jgi:hypothetical protein
METINNRTTPIFLISNTSGRHMTTTTTKKLEKPSQIGHSKKKHFYEIFRQTEQEKNSHLLYAIWHNSLAKATDTLGE